MQLVAVFQKAHALPRVQPALFLAHRLQQAGGHLDDEFFAIVGIGQVHRVIGVDQQQFARGEVVFLLMAAPQAVAAQQNLQVVDGFQGRRGYTHAAAVTDAAQVEAGKLAVIEAGLGAAGLGQANAVIAHVLVHIAGYRVGVGLHKHPTALTQQMRFHNPVTLIVIIGR